MLLIVWLLNLWRGPAGRARGALAAGASSSPGVSAEPAQRPATDGVAAVPCPCWHTRSHPHASTA
ncbi:MAG: hypothetical protein LBP52_07745 [Burkholderiaceae bacterium]|nr:hypothetical protein [Burkholderiaceae bacterium]